jgi:hypothetical protein
MGVRGAAQPHSTHFSLPGSAGVPPARCIAVYSSTRRRDVGAPRAAVLPILNLLFSIFAFISIFAFSLQPFLPAIALATAGAFSLSCPP